MVGELAANEKAHTHTYWTWAPCSPPTRSPGGIRQRGKLSSSPAHLKESLAEVARTHLCLCTVRREVALTGFPLTTAYEKVMREANQFVASLAAAKCAVQ